MILQESDRKSSEMLVIAYLNVSIANYEEYKGVKWYWISCKTCRGAESL